MTDTETGKTALFPLGRPLYPGVLMKLRIFEQRYLKLVRDSMRTGEPFGVVPITSGREVGSTPIFMPWGTLVNIVDFDQQPDGLLGITIEGRRRFRVINHAVAEDGLIVADIEPAEEEPVLPPEPEQKDLLILMKDLVSGLKVGDVFPPGEPTQAQLSWRLATLLPLPGEVAMSLLKEGDPEIRLDIIRECLVDLTAREKPVN